METKRTAVLMNLCTVAGLIGMGFFIFYGVQNRIFVSKDALELFLHDCGMWAPVLFGDLYIITLASALALYWLSCSPDSTADLSYGI